MLSLPFSLHLVIIIQKYYLKVVYKNGESVENGEKAKKTYIPQNEFRFVEINVCSNLERDCIERNGILIDVFCYLE